MLLIIVMFACFEFDRMLLTYTSLANSARVGARYAIVHGNTGGIVSGPGDDPASVITVVKNMAVLGLLKTDRLTVWVRYPDGRNTPGSRVTVTVQYPYDPWVPIPVRPNLVSTSAGVIVY
jgi:Flp pilus assembly protein TadG